MSQRSNHLTDLVFYGTLGAVGGAGIADWVMGSLSVIHTSCDPLSRAYRFTVCESYAVPHVWRIVSYVIGGALGAVATVWFVSAFRWPSRRWPHPANAVTLSSGRADG